MTVPHTERRLQRRTWYRGRVIDLYVDRVRLPNGSDATREVVDHRPAVAVVAWTDAAHVLLVRQYRYAVGRALWELPAGIINPGEGPRRAAARELREETGYRAARWRALGAIYSSPGFCRERIHLYLAHGLVRVGPPRPDADEFLTARAVPGSQVRAWVRRGLIRDGKTLLGLFWSSAPRSGFRIARKAGARYTTLGSRAAHRGRRTLPRKVTLR